MEDFSTEEIVTLDMVEDAFSANPCAATASEMVLVAEGYANDGMIEDDELASIRSKAAPYQAA